MVEIGISTIIETLWKTFRDRVSSEVTSVTIDDKGVTDALTVTIQKVHASMSNAVISSKSNYPLIVVNTPDINSQYYTAKRDEIIASISIDVYTTQAPAADKLMSKVYTAIETYKHTLSQAGIEQVHLDSSDSDSAQREGFIAHMRTLTFTFKTHFNKTW